MISGVFENIGYEFTPLQAAWLVWQCESITLKEKHAVWQEIIDNSPDCDVPERLSCRNWKSLCMDDPDKDYSIQIEDLFDYEDYSSHWFLDLRKVELRIDTEKHLL